MKRKLIVRIECQGGPDDGQVYVREMIVGDQTGLHTGPALARLDAPPEITVTRTGEDELHLLVRMQT